MGIFIIAEIGINHNGSLEVAKQLIDVAKEAGADAVKFQKRTIDQVYSKEMLDSPRESRYTEGRMGSGLKRWLPGQTEDRIPNNQTTKQRYIRRGMAYGRPNRPRYMGR